MRILWIALQALPAITRSMDPSAPVYPIGGWITGMASALSGSPDHSLGFCFPDNHHPQNGSVSGIRYYSVRRIPDFSDYTREDLTRLEEILDDFRPDIIQVFGTEYTHQTEYIRMLVDLGWKDRLCVWIQGLVSACAQEFQAGLPESVMNGKTFKELLRGGNLSSMQQNMAIRGMGEQEAIRSVRHAFVRTGWDSSCCLSINPDLELHFCNETLRGNFYLPPVWSFPEAVPHRIFVSQCNYPIKGFHQLVEALPDILKLYPDTTVVTTGPDFLRSRSLSSRIRLSSYQKYLRSRIRFHRLENCIRFSGTLDAEQMQASYCSAHVFVSPSSIENSSNSIGEAMLLGVPCVASDVGGTRDLLVSGQEGLLYPFSEPAALADAVVRIFRSRELAEAFSESAKKRAGLTHSPARNLQALIQEYSSICRNS